MTDKKLTPQLKESVKIRANYCCEYCYSQEKFATQTFSFEHIYPLSKGGQTQLDNLALACQGCNNHKYNKTGGCSHNSETILPSLVFNRLSPKSRYFSSSETHSFIVLSSLHYPL